MKNRKRCIEYFSFYNHTGIEAHFTEMARKGWLIESISNLYWPTAGSNRRTSISV